MKIYLVGNIKDIKEVSKKISNILKIDVFELNEISKINNLIKTVKSWIIISSNIDNFDIISNQSNKIIYLDYKNNDLKIYDKITKYSRKVIIIKNKKEEKTLIKAIIEGHDFYL